MGNKINNDIIPESVLKAIYRLLADEIFQPINKSIRYLFVAGLILFFIFGLPLCFNLLIMSIFNPSILYFITGVLGVAWCFIAIKALTDFDLSGVGTGSIKHWIEYGELKRNSDGKVIW